MGSPWEHYFTSVPKVIHCAGSTLLSLSLTCYKGMSHTALLSHFPLPSSLTQINLYSLGVCMLARWSVSSLFFILFQCYNIKSTLCFLQASLLHWLFFTIFILIVKNLTFLWGNVGTSDSLVKRSHTQKWEKPNTKISI